MARHIHLVESSTFSLYIFYITEREVYVFYTMDIFKTLLFEWSLLNSQNTTPQSIALEYTKSNEMTKIDFKMEEEELRFLSPSIYIVSL